jgi:hypothetical protein
MKESIMNRETSRAHEILKYKIIMINEAIESAHKIHNNSDTDVHVINTIFSLKNINISNSPLLQTRQ